MTDAHIRRDDYKPGGILLLVVVAVFTLIAIWILWPHKGRPGPRPEPPRDKPASAEFAPVEAAKLRNEGLAHLENGTLDRSNALFTELEKLLPEDPLPARNRAISLVMSVTEGTPTESVEAQDQLRDEATGAALRVQELEPESDAGFALHSKLAQHLGDNALALDKAKQATKAVPNSAPNWYQLYTLLQFETDPDLQLTAREALRTAQELAPTNVVLLLELLMTQAQAEDPAIQQTLEAAVPVFNRLKAGILTRTRVDPQPFLDGAIAAAEAQDWGMLVRNLGPLRNITMPDPVAKSDRRRIDRNPLEFVLKKFSPEVQARLDEARTAPGESIEVAFEASPLQSDVDLTAATDILALDFDLDRNLDLAVRLPDRIVVLSQGEQGEWSATTTIETEGSYNLLLAADLDTDGNSDLKPDDDAGNHCHTADQDLIVYGEDGLQLFEAQLEALGGPLTYSIKETGDELAVLKQVRVVEATDLNSDGDLDLVILSAQELTCWTNNGNWTFTQLEVSPEWGNEMPVDVVAVDWDRDIDMDLLISMKSGTVGVLENLLLGTFRWTPLDLANAGIGWPERDSPAPQLQVADANSDGNWEILIGTETETWSLPTTFLEPGEVIYSEATALDFAGASFQIWDFDNDGSLDLLANGPDALATLRGEPGEIFSNEMKPVLPGVATGAVNDFEIGDVDGDGDQDVLALTSGGIQIVTNNGGSQNHWIDVGLLAEQQVRGQTSESGRVNHFGIGSVVELRTGTQFQQRLVTSPVTHFGLGSADKPDAIRVIWPNGIPENVVHPDPNSLICEKQSLKGSCPYLYTWNGTRVEFVTDLLWASPIGLQDATGQLVPSREWEYLKLSGDQLAEKEGEYLLHITEELWEFAYFDQVELIAVDHPADVEIFTNDKVGPPPITEYKIHTAHEPRYPVSATNQSGRDLLPEILHRDEDYARVYDKKITQGYVEDCYLELDLGLKEKPEQLKLFLTGWIYPTDTSINVALQQNPDLPGPRAPWISVPNEAGEFVEAVPFMGFPGGKTKTIVVDIGRHINANDPRIRVRTSAQIYWDSASLAIQNQPAPFVTQDVQLHSAEVAFHGFSQRSKLDSTRPETYDYANAEPSPKWPPLRGRVTRFGECRERLVEWDDSMVVISGGDEIRMQFKPPAKKVPEGWKRDFILHCVGWDKDADLNTLTGQSIGPLPIRNMQGYPPTLESADQFEAVRQKNSDSLGRRQAFRAFWRRGSNQNDPFITTSDAE
ncbi:MAG: VCBS repeat-containing protein [Planctomycetaceae bacterium]|nr:VCBS repeat-containing protein [Planctomycetaceae bacterium]